MPQAHPESTRQLAVPPPGGDRRAAPRYKAGAVLLCWPAALPRKEGFPALLVNVSVGGVALAHRYRLAPGTLLFLDLSDFTGAAEEPLLAEVIHVKPHAGRTWQHGCALRKPLTEAQLRACQ